jgi:lipoate---protein ligase
MIKRGRAFVSTSTDPYLNLALEDWFLRKEMKEDERIILWWRNSPCVVIGRFQNPWKECNTRKMGKDGVPLVRRQSGGGAVFHDLGNSNFSFMSNSKDFRKEDHYKIIINVLRRFGIEADTSERRDLRVDNRKFSGSAFKLTPGGSFHHGTLLINADLERLNIYLRSHHQNIKSKGVDSVRAEVVNLSELSEEIEHSSIINEVNRELEKFYGIEVCDAEILEESSLYKIDYIREKREEFSSWEWRIGETPKFSQKLEKSFDWGDASFELFSHRGKIVDVVISLTSIDGELSSSLTDTLMGCKYSSKSIDESLERAKDSFPKRQDMLDEIKNWLQKEIS